MSQNVKMVIVPVFNYSVVIVNKDGSKETLSFINGPMNAFGTFDNLCGNMKNGVCADIKRITLYQHNMISKVNFMLAEAEVVE